MTSIATSFDSIAQLVEIIKALKPFGKTVNYQKIDSFRDELGIVDSRSLLNQLTKQLMLEENTDLVKFIFDDMEYDNYPVPTLAAVAALHVMDPYHSSTTQVDNFKLLLSIIISRNISISDTLADNSDDLFDYYSSNPIPEIVDLIVLNLGDFRLQDLQDFNIFKGIVQRISRADFYAKVQEIELDLEKWEDEYMAEYDKAAKQRAVEVSLGLGYAQFDNQEQSTIPSLVLQEIVNQSADLSGMPGWQVYQIVKHINEGTTDKTVRLGQPSNFEDANN